ncbi:hypothetical protein LamDB_25160 [Bacillus anthracis]|uniref:Uncharacterized protein n=1 Tax=Bacillus anthracis TaxID=1392 RepID=A0A640NCA8_BACAN|nr:hypothetical protein LamDB_25160 [Bacillus anthracis]
MISGSSIFLSLFEAVLLDLFWKSGLSVAFEVKEWLINTTIGVIQKAINKNRFSKVFINTFPFEFISQLD